MEQRTCHGCPTPLTKKPGPGRWPKWCVECHPDKHRQQIRDFCAVAFPNCVHCGQVFCRGQRRARHCSPSCRSAYSYAKQRADGRYEAQKLASRRNYCTVYFLTCAVCSEAFAARRSNSQFCSAICKSRAYNAARKSDGRLSLHNAKSRRLWLEKVKQEHGSLRRAYPIAFQALDERRAKRVLAATTGERFTHRQVFERDLWICQLCREPIVQSLAWPDPMSASLDHVIPLARGGAHSLANAQASHLVCNQRKHTKVA